jgi:membrane-bound ClpP family serine protease
MRKQGHFTHYLWLQIPEWILSAGVLLIAQRWFDLSPWTTSLLFVAWVAKDFVLYPFVKTAYEGAVRTGAEQLIGLSGTAHTAVNPQGYVRVMGELWRARLEAGAQPIAKGTGVRVRAAHGLTLIVTTDSLSAPAHGVSGERH